MKTLQTLLAVHLILGILACGDPEKDKPKPSPDTNEDPIEISELQIVDYTSGDLIHYGNVYPNYLDHREAIHLRNIGSKNLKINNIKLPSGFNFTFGFQPVTLPHNGEITYVISFAPTEFKKYQGSIEIISDADKGNHLIQVSGIGSDVTHDYNGNEYHIIEIGNQLWIKENFRGTNYINGSNINNITSFSDKALDEEYGKLYNDGSFASWNLATGKLSINTPDLIKDFSIPLNTDWEVLINHLGHESVAGGALKQTGFDLWKSPNLGATNSSNFSAKPSVMRGGNLYIGSETEFLSIDINATTFKDYVYRVILSYDSEDAVLSKNNTSSYTPIRLVHR